MSAGTIFQTDVTSWKRPPAGHLFALVLLAMVLGGCDSEAYYRKQVNWGYVLEMGGAKTITQWTLEQEDPERINHGQAALQSITALDTRDDADARDAVEGYLQVHRKLMEGWPGLEAWEQRKKDAAETRQQLLEISRASVYSNVRVRPDKKWTKQLLEEMKRLDPEGMENEEAMQKEAGEPPPWFDMPDSPGPAEQ